MTLARQNGVEAHLTHHVCPPHEEVDDSVGHHAVGKALDVVVVAISDVQTVALLSPSFHRDGVSKCCRVTCHLSDCTANLPSPGQRRETVKSRSKGKSKDSHQIQSGLLQDVHHLLQLGVLGEDEIVVHPQHVLRDHLRHGQVPPCKPALQRGRQQLGNAKFQTLF